MVVAGKKSRHSFPDPDPKRPSVASATTRALDYVRFGCQDGGGGGTTSPDPSATIRPVVPLRAALSGSSTVNARPGWGCLAAVPGSNSLWGARRQSKELLLRVAGTQIPCALPGCRLHKHTYIIVYRVGALPFRAVDHINGTEMCIVFFAPSRIVTSTVAGTYSYI